MPEVVNRRGGVVRPVWAVSLFALGSPLLLLVTPLFSAR